MLKITKPLLIGITLCTLVFFPGAASARNMLMLDDLLQRIEQRYQNLNAFMARFKQHTSSAAAAAMATEASGRLYYQKPKMMRWEYEQPEVQIFVVNGSTAWLHVPADQQITLFDKRHLFASPLIRTLFDGIIELQKHFLVRFDNKKLNDSQLVLDLTPKNDDPNVQSVKLWIDPRSYDIVALQTRDALGNVNRLDFESQKVVDQLPKALFQLEIPDHTSVVDNNGRALTIKEIRQLQRQVNQIP